MRVPICTTGAAHTSGRVFLLFPIRSKRAQMLLIG